jgi:CRISPR/Cas system-associated exonuclease Cas4 (RecB family)
MTLPDNFHFSQSSLQDFVDCRRRFQLRYLLHVAWPAVETEPALENERFMQQGAAFHRLVHQQHLGVPAEALDGLAQEEDLRRWWGNYLGPGGLKGSLLAEMEGSLRFSETSLSAPLGNFRLLAKYDLIAIAPDGSARILDWKTSRKRPRRPWLAARLQTRLYPYLLVRAGAQLNGGKALLPEAVEMLYWFADFPEQPERFPYSQKTYQEDERYLLGLIETLQRLGEQDFPLTSDEKRCAFCVYRSLCNRGVRAGDLEKASLTDEASLTSERGDGSLSDLDFEQIAEIAY